MAVDEAGNERVIGVPVTFLPVRFPKDTINLTEAFLRRKMPELVPQTPSTASVDALLQAFLRVNGEGRKGFEAKNREIGTGQTSPKPLWTGAFRQQSNTKVFANFPEERTYQMDGRTVDTQWHLGIDLASNRQSPVEASNAGRVVFTGPNGIYGNMVVVDHGLGLMTLYAHLSDIAVKVGQTVQRGEALGRSGETGLAGGDHLHFAHAHPRGVHEPARVVGRPLAEGPDREAAGRRGHHAARGSPTASRRRGRPRGPPRRLPRSAARRAPGAEGGRGAALPGTRRAPLQDDRGDGAADGEQEEEQRRPGAGGAAAPRPERRAPSQPQMAPNPMRPNASAR